MIGTYSLYRALPFKTVGTVRLPEAKAGESLGAEPNKRLRRLRIVLPKGQMHLEDVDHETLGMLIEALR